MNQRNVCANMHALQGVLWRSVEQNGLTDRRSALPSAGLLSQRSKNAS